MKQPPKEFSDWYATLPLDKQLEIAREIAVKSGFAEAALKISWNPDAVTRLKNGLKFVRQGGK